MSQRQIQLNPLNKPATWEDIKTKREQLKRAPITTNKGTFDVDDISFQNITTAIGAFASLSDPQSNSITWKMEDNSFSFVTLADLEEVRNAVAIRANVIHTYAEVISAGSYKVKDLYNESIWGIV